MTASNYTTTILVPQTATEVFNAINQVSAWWQGDIEGKTNHLNDEFIYRMKDVHHSTQRIIEFIANQKVVWLVTESKLNFTANQSEWTGSRIIFEIEEMNQQTQLIFTHEGLIPSCECYNGCSSAWKQLIEKSLYSLITTGKGTKVFGD